MSRVNNRSALERFVFSYLNKLKFANNLRSERPYLIKALVLIDSFLGDACCIDGAAVRAYGTRRENFFTHTVRGILNQEPLKRNVRKSFENAKRMILNKLFNPCCYEQFTVDSDSLVCAGEEPVTLTFVGLENQGTYVVTLPSSTTTYNIPLIGTYNITATAPTATDEVYIFLRNNLGQVVNMITVGPLIPEASLENFNMVNITSAFAQCAEVGQNPAFVWPISSATTQFGHNAAVTALYFFAVEENGNPVTYSFSGLPSFATVNNLTHGPYQYAEVILAPAGAGDNGVYNIFCTATSGSDSVIASTVLTIQTSTSSFRFTRPYAAGGEWEISVGDSGSSTNIPKTPGGGILKSDGRIYPAVNDWGTIYGTGYQVQAFEVVPEEIGEHLAFAQIGRSTPNEFQDSVVLKITVNPA